MLLWERRGEVRRGGCSRACSAGWRELAEARIALCGDVPGVDSRIAEVPAALTDDPGLAYERFDWRLRRNRDDDAHRADAGAVARRAWAGPRRGRTGAARWRAALMREGEPEPAYRLASQHGLTEGSDYADLEWLAGYIALTYLGEPDVAADHFARFGAAVQTPISLGRAGLLAGPGARRRWATRRRRRRPTPSAPQHQTSFYGLLAAEKAGLPHGSRAGRQRRAYPDWDGLPAAESRCSRGGRVLLAAGERTTSPSASWSTWPRACTPRGDGLARRRGAGAGTSRTSR